jgi:hypothetical protein
VDTAADSETPREEFLPRWTQGSDDAADLADVVRWKEGLALQRCDRGPCHVPTFP